MTMDWHTFKSSLGQNTFVTYIDDEESEVHVDSELEFQEALRLAKLSKKPLRLILNDKLHPGQKRYLSVDVPVENPAGKVSFYKMSAMLNNSSERESCQCGENGPPEWFTHYMKKFKKELLHELKSYIHDSIHSTIEKEKKLFSAKSDSHDLASERNDSVFPVSSQIRKKKKSEKDSGDVLDQREAKLQRKLEKLHSTKSERLEKLDNKMRILFEEKRRLSERKRHSRPKLEKIWAGASEKKNPKKSVFFLKNNVLLYLSPGSEFVLKVDVINDGTVPWSDPRLECFDVSGLYLKETCVRLARLNPMESSYAMLTGKASSSAGPHRLRCRVVDGPEPLLPEFTCWARVEMFESAESSPKECAEAVGNLIDVEKEIIASSQKKIEENIIEIQRRLHDIDLLRPSSGGEGSVKNNGKRASGKGKVGCDLLQGVETKEKSWKERLEEENVLFGVDCLAPTVSSSETSEGKGNETTDSFEKIQNDGENSSDSDMSVIFVSEEEDDNFIVIPKDLSPAESVNEVSVPESPKKDSKANEQPEPAEVAKEETQPPKEKTTPLQSAARSLSPLGEENKPKKMKSKSTEYHFTAENLTQPTFTQLPEGTSERVPTFKFTAGKDEKREERRKKVPKTDASGNVIYAVNSSGCCLPMEEETQQEEAGRGKRKGEEPRFHSHNQERRSDRFNEIPAVNILPNALMNGASNVASLAFNTAKSVLNNLQSAFVTEGKTERPGFRDFEEAMCRLYDMGFLDFHRNQELLYRHSNNLTAVVEELVRMQEQARNNRNQ